MPHKAFKLLNSQNFTSKLFKSSFKRNKQRNQEYFLLVKKFHITTYCNTKKSSILQATKHQNKDNIDYNPLTPDSFHIYCSHSDNQKPDAVFLNLSQIHHPNFRSSLSKLLSVSIHKKPTNDQFPFKKQHPPLRTPNTKLLPQPSTLQLSQTSPPYLFHPQ